MTGMLACAIALVPLSATPSTAGMTDEYADGGTKGCLDCHGNERVLGILKTLHAKREDPKTPLAQKACESCHGPSKIHSQFPMQIENVHFGKGATTQPKAQNQMCLECHRNDRNGDRENWSASAHGFENIVCSTCHGIHDLAKNVPSEATLSRGCSVDGCHATLAEDAKAATYTHAVGKKIDVDGQHQVTCAGCHNPHGPLNSGRCVNCHPQTPEILSKESEKARRFHQVATERGTECIRCHKALSHPIEPLQLKLQNEEMQRMLRESTGTAERTASPPTPEG